MPPRILLAPPSARSAGVPSNPLEKLGPSCYGTMFPSLRDARKASGKVFSFAFERLALLRRKTPRVEIDAQQWSDCVKCEAREHCYQLSMGKLALEAALRKR